MWPWNKNKKESDKKVVEAKLSGDSGERRSATDEEFSEAVTMAKKMLEPAFNQQVQSLNKYFMKYGKPQRLGIEITYFVDCVDKEEEEQ